MKKTLLACAIVASVALVACNKDEGKKDDAAKSASPYTTNVQKVSYGIGLNISKNFKQQNITLDMDAFNAGMKDGNSGAEPALKQEEIMQAMQEFQKELMEKQAADRIALETKNKSEAESFFKENGTKEGVVTTASGLQYKVITKGTGTAKPKAEDTVVVHYRGTLLNGEEFDSSYSRNTPATFPVGQVIPGWTEALQLMSPGDKFELYIPSDLAYGAGGAGAKIGPHAALKFEVELMQIVDPNSLRQPPESAHEAPGSENKVNSVKSIKGTAKPAK